MAKQAVLLVNLGSPDSTSVPDVRAYLKEFLGDERVIDVPFVRKFIIPAFVLTTRPKQSAHAYEAVWTDEGSPLIVVSQEQHRLLDEHQDLPVYLAMRYANPSIPDVLEQIVKDGVDHLFLIPLYPQYAMSSYETVVVRVMEAAAQVAPRMRVDTLQPFYDHPEYIEALRTVTAPHLEAPFDKLLFSFHGVPERQVKKSDPSRAHCLQVNGCCDIANPAHRTCYRHQCFTSARLLADSLGLASDQWTVSFQSRLLRDPWLGPYTDATIERLAREGVRRLRVICPAFVTDCLETLEEIAIQGKETFVEAGGEDFELIPCLNDHPAWVDFLAKRVSEWKSGASVVPPMRYKEA